MSDILQIKADKSVPKWKQEELTITQEIMDKLKKKLPEIKMLLDPRGTFDLLALSKNIPKVIAEIKIARQRKDVKVRTITFRIKNAEIASCRQLNVPVLVWIRKLKTWMRLDATKLLPNESTQELADNPKVNRRISVGSKSYAIEGIMSNEGLLNYLEKRINET